MKRWGSTILKGVAMCMAAKHHALPWQKSWLHPWLFSFNKLSMPLQINTHMYSMSGHSSCGCIPLVEWKEWDLKDLRFKSPQRQQVILCMCVCAWPCMASSVHQKNKRAQALMEPNIRYPCLWKKNRTWHISYLLRHASFSQGRLLLCSLFWILKNETKLFRKISLHI